VRATFLDVGLAIRGPPRNTARPMATTWTNDHGIPTALVEAITDHVHRPIGRYSVTQLLEPPRIRRLLEQNDVTADVSERLWSMLGSGIHAVLAERGAETELQIAGKLGGVWVSGTIDASETPAAPTGVADPFAPAPPAGGGPILRDWKMTSVYTWKAGGREEWERQLNLYSWLMQRGRLSMVRRPGGRASLKLHTPRVPSALLVTMIFRDWSAARAARAVIDADGLPDYPPAACATIELPRWEIDYAEEFARKRLDLHLAANAVHMPSLPALCSDAERWHRPGAFAVMKKGRKTAMRLLPSRADAVAWAEHNGSAGLYIDERPGADVRCESYCSARSVCPHAIQIAATAAAASAAKNQPQSQPQETE
jgi:hypothetical protein